MAYGTHYLSIALDGAGAGSDTLPAQGLLMAIRVLPSSGTPAVTVADDADTMLNAVTVTGDTTYHPQAEIQNNAAAGQGLRTPFALTGGVTITITSGAVSGSVEIWLKIL